MLAHPFRTIRTIGINVGLPVAKLSAMKLYIFTGLILISHAVFAQNSLKGKVLLAVFAHPDDEETIGPVLAKYASEGVAVYLLVATDGRLGVAEHFHVPAGDSLAAIRSKEIACAAAQLGIRPPILLGLHDQLDAATGGVGQSLDSIRKAVASLIIRLRPDVILTWGPSGLTGHPDHRLVGDVVTEVFESRKWAKNPKLYFGEMPVGSIPADGPNFALVDSAYLTVRIPLSAEDLVKAKNAWLCHKSQYTPEVVQHMHGILWNANKPVAYFRPFIATGKMQNSVFK
jgi:LmbE family N-acetylglucosaminyl deacetylase